MLFEDGGKVYIDGVLVDEKNYTSKEGSTIITLKKDYLETLSIGKHELKVVFGNGKKFYNSFYHFKTK